MQQGRKVAQAAGRAYRIVLQRSRRAGHDEGETEGSKGLTYQGRIFLSACCRFCPGTAYIVTVHQ